MSVNVGDKVVYLEEGSGMCFISSASRGTVIGIRDGSATVDWLDDTVSQVMIGDLTVVDLEIPRGTEVEFTSIVYAHPKGSRWVVKGACDKDWDYYIEPLDPDDLERFHVSAAYLSVVQPPQEVALESKSDAVTHPTHYNAHPSGVECIDLIRGLEFPIGNAVKYVWRAGLKDGNAAEQDLDKALYYLDYAHNDPLFTHYNGFVPADLAAKVIDSAEGIHKMFFMALAMYAGADVDGRYKAVDIMRKLIEFMK